MFFRVNSNYFYLFKGVSSGVGSSEISFFSEIILSASGAHYEALFVE